MQTMEIVLIFNTAKELMLSLGWLVGWFVCLCLSVYLLTKLLQFVDEYS